jgi:hypothetical protein
MIRLLVNNSPSALWSLACDNSLYGFKGAPSARHYPGRGPDKRQETPSHREEYVTETGTTTRTKAGSGGPLSDSGGGHVAPSRAEALTGAPPPPGRLARSRRSAVPAVTPRR